MLTTTKNTENTRKQHYLLNFDNFGGQILMVWVKIDLIAEKFTFLNLLYIFSGGKSMKNKAATGGVL